MQQKNDNKMIIITPAHVRAAMRVLHQEVGSFAETCGVGRATIARAIIGENMAEKTWLKLQSALEAQGFKISVTGLHHPTLFRRK